MEIFHHLTKIKRFTIVLALFVSIFSSCKKNKITAINPEFSKYIDAYTSGIISKKSSIKIQLATDASVAHTLNETVNEDLFNFSPKVKGKAFWVDARTIEFKPAEDLEKDKLYSVTFKLGKVLNVPSKFKHFEFNIKTAKPNIEVTENGLVAINKETMQLSGSIATADVEDSKLIEKILFATINGAPLTIKWQHNETNKSYNYTIENIKRSNDAQTLLIQWNGAPIGATIEDKKEIAVPAIGDFKVLSVKAEQENEQYALVQFSDPLMIGQQLDGLISMSNQENISYTILGSEVKVYASGRLEGNYTVNVSEGIQNQWSDKLTKSFAANIFFENRLPSVKIHGKGVILPNSGGKIVLPFEAINLKAVDVTIIKIYENNIHQFFQSNALDGENDLRRVAKPTVEATIKLDDDKSINLHKKNKFSLDIDKYIKAEQGAMYRIRIGFRPSYSLYTCTVDPDKENSENEDEEEYYNSENSDEIDEEDAFWNRYEDYYPYGYNWQQRDNPCSKAFYNKERFASRNILSTNIGVVAKRNNNNSLFVATNDIISTNPLSGVQITALDYQQQIIGKGFTNSDGITVIDLKRKPFLIVAKKGNEKSYLKVDDGSSLPLSKFNVDGAVYKNGIKGFVFGERGVWRPGDSLFITCMIEDKDNKLPKGHPIEMELLNPKGQIYKRLIQINDNNGFNVFKTATDANAPTGNWMCKIKCGGSVFDKVLKIETVMPNRLKIDLNFNGATSIGKNTINNIALNAKWLFGANAQNLKARVDAQLYKKTTSFDNYKEFVFDNPTANYSNISKTIFDGALNSNGEAIINPNFNAGANAPGMLLANLMVKVFEPGGNFSIDNVSIPYHPYNSYIGLKMPKSSNSWGYLNNNSTHTIQLADVNTNGTASVGNTAVEVQLYKVEWRWWWDRNEDDFSNFTQDQYNKLIKKEVINLSNGNGLYKLKFTEGDHNRYLILFKDTRSGHTTGTTFYVSDDYWRTRNTEGDASSVSMLSFTSDKTTYNVGEECKLTIPSSQNGRMLVSIENGTKVIKTFWTKTENQQTNFSFKIEKEMTPNVYINITQLQPHAQTINDLPIRMYGVLPINVFDRNTILKPTIKIAESIMPEVPNSITVGEENNKNMTYCIAIVDEGLLDLTRFKTPNPHQAFYAKEALGVKSWDVYDYVIGAWGSQIERILTIGGDGSAELAAKTRRANRFKPVVQYMGPFKSNGSNKQHQFVLPNYMGSVRVMVIAKGDNGYGVAEKAVKVKKPLMLLTTMPRVLGPSEEIKIPITIFATESNIKNVQLNVTTNSLIEANGAQNIVFTKTGEQQVFLQAKIKNTTGIGKFKVVAKSGNYTTYSEIEIEVRNPNNLITQSQEFVLQAGKSMNASIAMLGDASSSKAMVELSAIPSFNLQKRLNYLIQYPHGCVEQTTSAVFPQLYLSDMMDLDELKKQEVERNIKSAISRLQNFQTSEGGFAYWPGNIESDEWGTNYAGHFLIEANAKGYNVNNNLLQLWKQFQRNKANNWNANGAVWYGYDLTQAYRLYLLALAKAPEQGAMNRLKEYKFLTPEAKWRLAAAYYLIGQSQIATQLISNLPNTFTARTYAGYSYGSDVRDEAMILETLSLLNRKREAEQIVYRLCAKLSQNNWYSTQTTAYSLLAINKFCGFNKNGKINAAGIAGNAKVNINSNNNISQQNILWQNGKANINITNKGSNVLYVRVVNMGKPIGMDSISYPNNPNVLGLNVSYISQNGLPIDISKLKQGTDFVAKVTIQNPGNRGVYSQMALSQIFPSGWEILNTRLYNAEGAFTSSKSEYMDIRDDRVYYYFSINPKETLTYYVQLTAAYPGKYFWPGVYCEAMYDNAIQAGVSGKIVEVIGN
ncbi:MAG: alpha-2-macroglobulin family protein [Chitinophagaceae bacterium]